MTDILLRLPEHAGAVLLIALNLFVIYALITYLRTDRVPLYDRLPTRVQTWLLRLFAAGLVLLMGWFVCQTLIQFVHMLVQYVVTDGAVRTEGFSDIPFQTSDFLLVFTLGACFWGSLLFLSSSFRGTVVASVIERAMNRTQPVLLEAIGVLYVLTLAIAALYLTYRALFVVPLVDVAIAASVGTFLVLLAYGGVRIVHGHDDRRIGTAEVYPIPWFLTIAVALLVFLFASILILIFANMFFGDRASVYGTMLALVALVYGVYAYRYIDAHTTIMRTAHRWAQEHPMRIVLGVPGAILACILTLLIVAVVSEILLLAVGASVVVGTIYIAWAQMRSDYKEGSVPDTVISVATRMLDTLRDDYHIEPFVYETTHDEQSLTMLLNVYTMHDRDRLERWLAEELCTKLDVERIEITDCTDTSYEVEPIGTLCYVRVFYRNV